MYCCPLSLSFSYLFASFDTTKNCQMCVRGAFYEVEPFMDPPVCVQSFPLKESGVFAKLSGINGRYFWVVNSQQMTECCDRAGVLLYKQPSLRENAVAPALLSDDGKACTVYCRCRHIFFYTHKLLSMSIQCRPHAQVNIGGMTVGSDVKYQCGLVWASVINKTCHNRL